MWDNKRGQLGETMTWIVATLIIVVILSITILVAVPLGSNKQIKIEDKEKDFLATKSITSFLGNDENVGSLEKTLTDKNDKSFEEQVKKLLEILPASTKNGLGSLGSWDFQLSALENGETKIIISDFELVPLPTGANLDSFNTKISFKQLNLRFWNICLEKCR